MRSHVIQYAAGRFEPIHSRVGVIGFACAVAGACGILITMALNLSPMSGPTGARMRDMAPAFGMGVMLLWISGIVLGVLGIRERKRVRTFAIAALVTSAVTVELFVVMLSLY